MRFNIFLPVSLIFIARKQPDFSILILYFFLFKVHSISEKMQSIRENKNRYTKWDHKLFKSWSLISIVFIISLSCYMSNARYIATIIDM